MKSTPGNNGRRNSTACAHAAHALVNIGFSLEPPASKFDREANQTNRADSGRINLRAVSERCKPAKVFCGQTGVHRERCQLVKGSQSGPNQVDFSRINLRTSQSLLSSDQSPLRTLRRHRQPRPPAICHPWRPPGSAPLWPPADDTPNFEQSLQPITDSSRWYTQLRTKSATITNRQSPPATDTSNCRTKFATNCRLPQILHPIANKVCGQVPTLGILNCPLYMSVSGRTSLTAT